MSRGNKGKFPVEEKSNFDEENLEKRRRVFGSGFNTHVTGVMSVQNDREQRMLRMDAQKSTFKASCSVLFAVEERQQQNPDVKKQKKTHEKSL